MGEAGQIDLAHVRGDEAIVLAGLNYRHHLETALLDRFAEVVVPMSGTHAWPAAELAIEEIKGRLMTIRNVLRLTCAAVIAAACTQARAAPLKQMPIDFVGEWCNGETFEGETNWKLPSWLEEDNPKCTNILSVTKYDFSMVIGKKSFYCLPDAIRLKEDTAPSGTAYLATINAHCTTGQETGRGNPATFSFHRYKGNIYIKEK